MKEEVELVAIFLVLASNRMETLYIICFGPGNGKVKIDRLYASSGVIYMGRVFRV